jgi:hypothetical protein
MDKPMTKTTAKTATPGSDYFASIQQAFENAQGKIEVPAAARDLVKRTVSSAKDSAEKVHTKAADATKTAEKFATSLMGGYASFTRGLLDATLANVQHALSTVEKVAGAQSINEAVQIHADFVRESARANFERARVAADTVKSVVTEGAENAQAEFSKFYGQQAA